MNRYTEKYSNAKAYYLSNLEITGASPKTLRNYERSLRLFLDFWGSSSPESDPSASDIRAWRDYLTENGLAASTVRCYLSDLSYFFSAMSDPSLEEDRAYNSNPVSRRFYPKIESRPYDMILTDRQVCRLWLREKPLAEKVKYFPRNYAIVVLLLTSKIRNAELLNLRLCDIDFDNDEITVERGKGGKFRRVYLQPIAKSGIRLYLESGIRPQSAGSDDYLFGTTSAASFGTNDRTEQWHKGSSQWLSDIVERYVFNAVGVHGVRTHDLRHIGSRLELNSGSSIELLQSELGHSSIVTTQIYTGRLEARGERASAIKALAERDRQAENNFELIRPA